MRRLLLAALLVPAIVAPACNLTSHARVDSIYRLNEGVKQLQKNNYSGAEKAINEAIKADSTHAMAYYFLGKLHRKQDKWVEAEKAYEGAIRNMTDAPNADYYFELGLCQENQGKVSGITNAERDAKFLAAIKSYEEAITLNDKLYRAHFHIGTLYEKMDKPEQSDKSYRSAIALNGHYSPAFVALGNMYIDYGFSNVAMAILETGTKTNDTDASMWNGLGRAMLNLNRGQEAVEAYKTAKAIDPDMPDVLFGLGMAYAELRQRTEAVENLQAFLDKAGNTVPEHVQKSARDTLARMNDVI